MLSCWNVGWLLDVSASIITLQGWWRYRICYRGQPSASSFFSPHRLFPSPPSFPHPWSCRYLSAQGPSRNGLNDYNGTGQLKEASSKAVSQWISVIVEFNLIQSILAEIDFLLEFDQILVEFLPSLVVLREWVDVGLVVASHLHICPVDLLHRAQLIN